MVTRAKPPTAPSVAPAGRPSPTILLRLPHEWALSDETFLELCRLNDGWRFETDEQGSLRIMTGVGLRSSARALRIGSQVDAWDMEFGDGVVTGADGEYRLDERTRRAPDVAWISPERLAQITDDEGLGSVCPDFVVEVRSRSDQLGDQQAKMELWLAHGVRLGWLIDPFGGVAYIYRPDQAPEKRSRPESLGGEDVLTGLGIDLTSVWPDA